MKLVTLSVRDLALPVPRTGSIEALSGYGRATQEGQEIHLRVQRERSCSESCYEAEVPIARDLDRGGFRFRVGGRMDGIFRFHPPRAPRIEEIKTTFNIGELIRRLEAAPHDHPYCLQLGTYGYFHWLETGTIPELSFHLVSTRDRSHDDLPLKLDIPAYERWLEQRLEELVTEATRCEKRARRRRKTAASFAFPFDSARPGQSELIHSIEEGMAERRRMLIQAPTGLGKTAGVLYPALKEALTRGQKVIYVTPKNSQHSVAEDAVERFQEKDAKVRSLTITAKSKICFKNEPLCNPEYCEYARDYYRKIQEHGLVEKLARKRKLTSRVFREMGEEYQVCPFELQLEAAQDAEAVICDYNYVFAPRAAMARLGGISLDQEGKPNLVIDEAHNLPARAMEYYSPALSSAALEKMREPIRELPRRFAAEAEELLDQSIQVIVRCRPDGATDGRGTRITPAVAPFMEHDAALRAFLSRYLESDVEIQPRDVALRLCFYWSEFTAALEYATDPGHEEFFTTFQPHPTGGTVKITCCDASGMLRECYDEYQQVVAFSATLKPFEYYARLSGLDPETLRTAEFQSPFPRQHRKLLIIPQVSTKYSERERNYPRIAEAISRIAALKEGNYFAFFPSFEFLERTLGCLGPPEGYTILKQRREMKAHEIQAILDHLREGAAPTIVFAVQGGVFSEGVDYPGRMIIGAFVVGPPLPSFDLERERMREYYDQHYDGAGFEYAYAFPAMAKAVQAAGRVIRSETDRGLIVLLDNRFVQEGYSRSMPADWFESHPRELVSQSILREVSEFWAESS